MGNMTKERNITKIGANSEEENSMKIRNKGDLKNDEIRRKLNGSHKSEIMLENPMVNTEKIKVGKLEDMLSVNKERKLARNSKK